MPGNNQAPPECKKIQESSQHASESKKLRFAVETRIVVYWTFSKETARNSELVNQLDANCTAGCAKFYSLYR